MRFTKWAMLAVGLFDIAYAASHQDVTGSLGMEILGGIILVLTLKFWKRL